MLCPSLLMYLKGWVSLWVPAGAWFRNCFSRNRNQLEQPRRRKWSNIFNSKIKTNQLNCWQKEIHRYQLSRAKNDSEISPDPDHQLDANLCRSKIWRLSLLHYPLECQRTPLPSQIDPAPKLWYRNGLLHYMKSYMGYILSNFVFIIGNYLGQGLRRPKIDNKMC